VQPIPAKPKVHAEPPAKAPTKTAPEPTKARPPESNGSLATYPDLAALGRDNVAAMARANAALAKGMEELGQEVAGFAQHSLVSVVDAARALVGVRTIADLMALHRSVAQATLEGMMANSARMSEIGIRTATEALGPINERVAVAFERFGRPAR
jgi:phasin family protein